MGQLSDQFDLAIVGAGAVGLSIALWAQNHGLSVALIDRNEPGMGASFGNAGTIATYACTPINSPSIFKNLPYLLFSKQSPLRIDPLYAFLHMPWLIQFLRNCTSSRVSQITSNLSHLLARADQGLDPLLSLINVDGLIVNNGCLYVYRTPEEFEAASSDIALRRRNGVEFDVLNESAVKILEPALTMPVYRALFFSKARHVTNPGELMHRFFRAFIERGGCWLPGEVKKCKANSHAVTLEIDESEQLTCRYFALSAGAHSRSIVGSGAEAIPLDTERGYHLMFEKITQKLSRPVGWAKAGFYATPMMNGLRIAGTVEIAGLSPKINERRLRYLKLMAETMLGPLGEPSSAWVGFRPTLPDALPVIGPSPCSPRIIFAFGHQHIGLTLSGLTGKLVTDMVTGQESECDLAAFSSRRF